MAQSCGSEQHCGTAEASPRPRAAPPPPPLPQQQALPVYAPPLALGEVVMAGEPIREAVGVVREPDDQ